jgi:anti-sigma regulatory factor (Ser/Thr protein kinase)
LNSGSTYTEEFPARAESVPKARAAVAGFALAAGACRERQDAVTLAISEAVSNAVRHAYDQPGGSFQVTASFMPGELWLMVADDGAGIRPGRTPGGLGVGLAVIAQLADDFEIIKRSSGGTELRMRFQLRVERGWPTAPEHSPRFARRDLAQGRTA